MHGLMMDAPLLTSTILDHANRWHGEQKIVSRLHDGSIHSYTYAEAHTRTKKLANALSALGVEQGDRVGTLAWNNFRHFELYFAVSGSGAVTHTINPRLFEEQITYIINHADNKVLFVDQSFIGLVEKLIGNCPKVKTVVALCAANEMPQDCSIPNLVCYESLVEEQSAEFTWPALEERTAAALCYTSGTTGNPKGVLYSHRSTVLQTMATVAPDVLNISACDSLLPIVPMYHVNAWCQPFSAALVGAKLVLPGGMMDAASIHELMEQEEVTLSAGVPTIWQMLLRYLAENNKPLTTVNRVSVGGSACPVSIIRDFDQIHSVKVIQAWGMTETSPLGTVVAEKPEHAKLDAEQRYEVQATQGRPVFGVDIRIVDDNGVELARDGKTSGNLQVRGYWVCSEYFNVDAPSPLEDGWFPTGDVASISPAGFLRITDRAKDLIKSGGEWISSIDLENAAMSLAGVAEAAVIGVTHPRWDERPLMLVVAKDQSLNKQAILDHLQGKVAKWWLPEDVLFIEEIPHTATGKISKLTLREQYQNHFTAS